MREQEAYYACNPPYSAFLPFSFQVVTSWLPCLVQVVSGARNVDGRLSNSNSENLEIYLLMQVDWWGLVLLRMSLWHQEEPCKCQLFSYSVAEYPQSEGKYIAEPGCKTVEKWEAEKGCRI